MKRRHCVWMGIALLVAGAVLAGRAVPVGRWIEASRDWISSAGWAGTLACMGAYVVGATLFVPGSVLTLAMGGIFGAVPGGLMASTSAALAAGCSFIISRHLVRKRVEARVSADPKLRRLDLAVEKEGWKLVVLLRLTPVIPFALINYSLGVTRIGFWRFFIAGWLGMLPGSAVYAWLGEAGRTTLSGGHEMSTAQYALLGIGVAATVLLGWVVGRIVRRNLSGAQS